MSILKIFLFLFLLFPLNAFALTTYSCIYWNSGIGGFSQSGTYPNCSSGIVAADSSQLFQLEQGNISFQSEKTALQTQVATLQSEKTALQTQLIALQTQTNNQCPTNTSLLNQQSVICPSIWSFSGSYEDARQLGNVILGLFAIVFIIISVKKFFL